MPAPAAPASASASASASVPGDPESSVSDAGAVLPAQSAGERPAGPGATLRRTPVRGTVREPDRRPVPRAVLTLIDPTGRQVARADADAEGRWVLAAAAQGAHVLIAAAPGHQPQAVSIAVGRRPVELDVVLGGTGRISGVVRDPEGGAVSEATVTLTDAYGEVAAVTRTDSAGHYALRDLVSGGYTLTVHAAAFRPAALAVTVDPSVPTRQDVVLTGSGTLRGTVRTADGRPVREARVSLLDDTGAAVGGTITGDDGRFRFTDLAPGEYTVLASGYPPVAAALTVGDGSTERDLQLSHRPED